MSAPVLPDFEKTVRLSQGNLDAAELASALMERGARGVLVTGGDGTGDKEFVR